MSRDGDKRYGLADILSIKEENIKQGQGLGWSGVAPMWWGLKRHAPNKQTYRAAGMNDEVKTLS
jgi:hypothetical protein